MAGEKHKKIYTVWKIIWFLTVVGLLVFVVPIFAYFGMLLYFAWKDDTTYRYHHYRCDGKVFEVPFPLTRCRYRGSRVIYLESKGCGDPRYIEALETYPPYTPLHFTALYSTYDFEGGTFFKYLVSDRNGSASFLDFDNIDPEKCAYDLNDSWWFRNNRQYLPEEGEDAEKVDYNSLWKLFGKQEAPSAQFTSTGFRPSSR